MSGLDHVTTDIFVSLSVALHLDFPHLRTTVLCPFFKKRRIYANILLRFKVPLLKQCWGFLIGISKEKCESACEFLSIIK